MHGWLAEVMLAGGAVVRDRGINVWSNNFSRKRLFLEIRLRAARSCGLLSLTLRRANASATAAPMPAAAPAAV